MCLCVVFLDMPVCVSLQPKQRTSLSSSLDVQRPVNHSCEPSEVSSSLGYASFSTSPPASPPLSPNQERDQDSAGSNDDCPLTGKGPELGGGNNKFAFSSYVPPSPCFHSVLTCSCVATATRILVVMAKWQP